MLNKELMLKAEGKKIYTLKAEAWYEFYGMWTNMGSVTPNEFDGQKIVCLCTDAVAKNTVLELSEHDYKGNVRITLLDTGGSAVFTRVRNALLTEPPLWPHYGDLGEGSKTLRLIIEYI